MTNLSTFTSHQSYSYLYHVIKETSIYSFSKLAQIPSHHHLFFYKYFRISINLKEMPLSDNAQKKYLKAMKLTERNLICTGVIISVIKDASIKNKRNLKT